MGDTLNQSIASEFNYTYDASKYVKKTPGQLIRMDLPDTAKALKEVQCSPKENYELSQQRLQSLTQTKENALPLGDVSNKTDLLGLPPDLA